MALEAVGVSITVVVVDDNLDFRDAVADTVAADPRLVLVGQAASTAEASAVCSRVAPQCVLLDVQLCDEPLGAVVALVEELVGDGRTVVAVTAYDRPSVIRELVAAGITGFLVKTQVERRLGDVLTQCQQGEVVLASRRAAGAIRAPK